MQLREILPKMREYFDAQERLRELVLEGSRRVVRLSAKSIAAAHRGNRAEAEEMLGKAKETLEALVKSAEGEQWLLHGGAVLGAYREYSEAALLSAIIWDGRLPKPEEFGVPYEAYLPALADAAGELRRYFLDLTRGDELDKAGRALRLMEEIYEFLMEFDYPDAILPGFKHKQDMVRGILERTRGDLTLAMRQRRLEEALKRAGEG